MKKLIEKIRCWIISSLLTDSEKYLLYYSIEDACDVMDRRYVESSDRFNNTHEDTLELKNIRERFNLIKPI